MYELIDNIFWGVEWDCFHMFHIESDGSEGTKVRCELITKPSHNDGYRHGRGVIIGFENHRSQDCTERIEAIIRDRDLQNVKGFYFAVKGKRQAIRLSQKMREFSLGKVEMYGVDPDYFFSLVPLTGRGQRRIEKYILNLKMDFTILGRIKHIIKKLLISIGLSWPLYEKFVVIVNHIGESSNLTAGLNCDDLKAMGH